MLNLRILTRFTISKSMEKKEQKQFVTMVRPKSKPHKFEIKHALTLLKLQKSKGQSAKGWKIQDDKWEFKDGEIVRIGSTGTSKKS